MGVILDFIDEDLRKRGIGYVLHTRKYIIEKHDGAYNEEFDPPSCDTSHDHQSSEAQR